MKIQIDKSDLDMLQPHGDLVAAYHTFVDEHYDIIDEITADELASETRPFLELEGYMNHMGEL
jgi:hypothetical protein